MGRHDSSAPGEDALWLAAQAVRQSSVLTTAQSLVARGGRSNDAALHGRQYLERGLNADPERVFSARDYRYAADCLFGIGRTGHGEALADIAAADAELHAASQSWIHRYDRRPPTAVERHALAELSSGQVAERSRPGHGIDGAWYAPAAYQRTGRPAVVVTSSAGTRQVIAFGNPGERTAWLMSRAPEAPGPLMTPRNGPVTRTTQEEVLLAWLMRSPADTSRALGQLSPRTWTTHLRAELAGALRWTTERGGEPEYSVIGEAFARRLLRAPGTAAEEIGWPGMTRALAYLQRLAQTPVTRSQAIEAAGWLAKADAEALQNARKSGFTPAAVSHAVPAARSPVPGAARRTAAPVPRLLQAPPGVAAPGGPVPQM